MAWKLLQRRPERILALAVQRMMPKNKIGRHMLSKLRLFVGPQHPHQAQAPIPLELLSGRPSPIGAVYTPKPVPKTPKPKPAPVPAVDRGDPSRRPRRDRGDGRGRPRTHAVEAVSTMTPVEPSRSRRPSPVESSTPGVATEPPPPGASE